MARLLVSVRSVDEALLARNSGVDVIDVKEPSRGPLGQAESSTWRAIRAVLPPNLPMSIALGEWWEHPCGFSTWDPSLSFSDYRKVGPARSALFPEDYRDWAKQFWGPGWVAVAYADWSIAESLPPLEILEQAITAGCSGFLIDTYGKTDRSPLKPTWRDLVRRGQEAGLFVAVAGGLSIERIQALRGLRPDLFAVRGAACASGDRHGELDPSRLRALVQSVGLDPVATSPW